MVVIKVIPFIVVDLRNSEKNVLLYTSADRRLIQGMFVPDLISCPTPDLDVVPITPIGMPSYVKADVDIHMGYDPVQDVIYFSDQTVIYMTPTSSLNHYNRIVETGM